MADPWLAWLHAPRQPPAARHAARALGLARLVADAWEKDAGAAGLAAPLLDGRADALAAAVGDCFDDAAPPVDVVELHDADPDVDTAIQRALLRGAPCVVRGGAETAPRCVQAWATDDGLPNWIAFGKCFAGQHGRVTDVLAAADVRVCASVEEFAASQLNAAPSDDCLLYLKDVQFDQASPPGFLDDAVPAAARPTPGGDWLSHAAATPSPASTSLPSYRFVYAGPADAATPLHCDVYGSHAASLNAAGSKRWTFVAAADAPRLYDRFGRSAARWLDGRDPRDAAVLYPWLETAAARAVSIVQERGDTVFVRGSVWHCVENLTPAISLNVNFVDAACAVTAVASVLDEHVDADAAADVPHAPPRPPAPARQVDGSSLAPTGVGVVGFARVVVAAAQRDCAAIEGAEGKPPAAAVASAVAAADCLARLETYARSGGPHAAGLDADVLAAVGKAARVAARKGCAVLGVAACEE